MVRKVSRVFAAMALVVGVTACDDNPLAEDRDQASYFRLNPSVVTVDAGGTASVDAIVNNKFGAATNAAVTATPCDNKITAVADTGRSEFEYPERFIITGGNTLGQSCLVVRGGGLTDTVQVNVVPASVNVTGLDTLASGATATPTLQFFNTTGGAATGLTNTSFRYVSLNPTIVSVADTMTGELAGQAPGTGRVVVTSRSSVGATRADTVTIVVRAGAFTGTVTQSATPGGLPMLTFTQGALPFDEDTQARLLVNGAVVPAWVVTSTGNTRQLVVPYGVPAGAVSYDVINMGPNQVAAVGTVQLPNLTVADMAENDGGTVGQGPATTAAGALKVMTGGQTFYGSVGGTDGNDWVRVDITEAGNYTFRVDWKDGSDIDFRVRNLANTGSHISRLTSDHPEIGSANLAVGSYWVNIELYSQDADEGYPATTYQIISTKN